MFQRHAPGRILCEPIARAEAEPPPVAHPQPLEDRVESRFGTRSTVSTLKLCEPRTRAEAEAETAVHSQQSESVCVPSRARFASDAVQMCTGQRPHPRTSRLFGDSE